MRERVSENCVNTTSFKEEVEFSRETPHSVRVKRFFTDDSVTLHYAPTIEIIIVTDVEGEVIVGQSHHRFLPRDVVIIPPYYTHSTKCRKGSGKLINLKISMEDLKAFVNIPALIEWENASISGVFYAAELYDEMSTIVRRLIEKDDNIFERMHCMLDIAEILIRLNQKAGLEQKRQEQKKDARIYQLIQWTYTHYGERISVDEVARQVNMSKGYFCKFFKSISGITYITFLNQVRIEKATDLLKAGYNVTECAMACGFESISYFVQMFKRNLGCTPGQFLAAIYTQNDNITIE